MKIKRTTFYRITGVDEATDVPRDMLRYDTAFVLTRTLSGVKGPVVAFPKFSTKTGDTVGAPTLGRWNSFGCSLHPLTEAESVLPARDFVQFPKYWITYQHPRDVHGARVYSVLTSMTIEEYVAIEETSRAGRRGR